VEEREVKEREVEERKVEERKVEEREVEDRRLGVVGLHTCGSLAPASIKLFFSTRSAKFICNVGCCYHHLPEEFYTNPFLDDDNGGKETPGKKNALLRIQSDFF
jgi:hypothetical protein